MLAIDVILLFIAFFILKTIYKIKNLLYINNVSEWISHLEPILIS